VVADSLFTIHFSLFTFNPTFAGSKNIIVKKLYVLILRSYAGPALATFFIVVFVLLMQFLWRYVDELVGKGLEWNIILQLMFYASFTFVPMALPISILLASLMTFGNLGERYELVAMKAAGISLRKIMMPLGLFSLLISVGAFYYSNIIFPYANLKFRSTLYDVRQKKLSLNIREGIFYSGLQGYVIRIGKKEPDGTTIRKVMIYDHSQVQGNNKVVMADSGRMQQTADGTYLLLTLYNGTNYEEAGSRNDAQKIPFQRTSFSSEVIKFNLSQFKMTRSDDDFFKNAYYMLNVKQLRYSSDSLGKEVNQRVGELRRSLLSYYTNFTRSKLTDSLLATLPPAKRDLQFDKMPVTEKKNIVSSALSMARNVKGSFEYNRQLIKEKVELKARYDIEWHRKFTLSFACFALFLIGAPLGAIIRKGGLGMPLIISVLLFVTYHVISFTGEKAVRSAITDPWKGMWMSTMIFLPIGMFLAFKAANDSNIMDAESYRHFFKKVINKLRKKQQPRDEDIDVMQ
jgi:lipopolysaccharide export system permease protein